MAAPPPQKFKFRYLEIIIGLFITLTLLGLIAAVMLVGRGKGWFTEYRTYHIRFEDAAGIVPGTEVYLNPQGIPIGEVVATSLDRSSTVQDTNINQRTLTCLRSRVPVHVDIPRRLDEASEEARDYWQKQIDQTLQDCVQEIWTTRTEMQLAPGTEEAPFTEKHYETRVKVTVKVDIQFSQFLGPKSRAYFRQALLGGRSIWIDIDNESNTPLPDDFTIPTTEQDSTLRKIERAAETASTLMEEIMPRVKDLGEVMDALRDPDTGIRATLTTYRQAAEELKLTITDIRRGEGFVSRMIQDEQMYPKVRSMLGDLNYTLSDTREMVGALNDDLPEIMQNLKLTLGDAKVSVSLLRDSMLKLSPLMERTGETLGETRRVLDSLKRNVLIRGNLPPAHEPPPTEPGVRDAP